MDRRFSLALALSLIILICWQIFFAPKPSPKPVTPEAESAESANPGESAGITEQGDPGAVPPTEPGANADPDVPVPPSGGTDVPLNEEIWVETDQYKARLSNRGATLAELYSTVYERDVFTDEQRDELDDLQRLQPYTLDMDPEARGLLFRPSVSPGGARDVATSPWEHELLPVEGGVDVCFRFDDGVGTRYTKWMRFRDGLHDIEVQITLETDRQGAAGFELIAAGNATDQKPLPFVRRPSAVVCLDDDEMEIFTGEDLYDDGMETVPVEGRLNFLGSFNNHFAVVLKPDSDTAQYAVSAFCESVFDHLALQEKVEKEGLSAAQAAALSEDEDFHSHARSTLSMTLPLGGRTDIAFLLYAGPKLPSLMEDARYEGFRQLYVEDYGRFGFINRGLLVILRGFHSLVGNWGIAIILLTVLVKILLFPIMRMQSRSMEDFQKKMAKLKPKLDELKAKHKANPRKFQELQQKMMREHQVRPPVMGCLIILAQFPVFIGLFQILKSSFELRHQPFFGWIADLSQPDGLPLPVELWLPFIGDFSTLNLLPILMIIAMVFQFKSMPKPKDEQAAQVQKMMMIMPFGFGFFLYNYASGLSLYMLTNALLGIVQTKFFRVNTG